MCIYVYIYVYKHAPIYTCVYTYLYMYIYIYTKRLILNICTCIFTYAVLALKRCARFRASCHSEMAQRPQRRCLGSS